MQLFDLIGALAVRVALIDGSIASTERAAIERHFVDEWGYDPEYVGRALDVLVAGTDEARVKTIAKALADFQAASPDCNSEAMQSELVTFLREVVEADGILDEREELAVDAVVAVFKRENAITLSTVGRSLSDIGAQAGSAVDELRKRLKKPGPSPKAI